MFGILMGDVSHMGSELVTNLEDSLEKGLSRPLLSTNIMAPYIDKQYVSNCEGKQSTLSLKIGIVLSTLSPVTALKVHDKGGWLGNLCGTSKPNSLNQRGCIKY